MSTVHAPGRLLLSYRSNNHGQQTAADSAAAQPASAAAAWSPSGAELLQTASVRKYGACKCKAHVTPILSKVGRSPEPSSSSDVKLPSLILLGSAGGVLRYAARPMLVLTSLLSARDSFSKRRAFRRWSKISFLQQLDSVGSSKLSGRTLSRLQQSSAPHAISCNFLAFYALP